MTAEKVLSKHQYFPFLDGLRFFAITFVLINHSGLFSPLDLDWQWLKLYRHFSGMAGVHIFFVVSGFLIFWRLSDEYAKNGNISLKKFYIRRARRLLPLFFVFLSIALGLSIFGIIHLPWLSVVMAATYTYNFVPNSYYTDELGHLWSLSVEEQFYLIAPVLFFFKSARKRMGAILFIFLSSLFLMKAIKLNPFIMKNFNANYWTPFAAVHLAIGCMTGALFYQFKDQIEKWSRFQSFFVLIGAVVLYFCHYWLPSNFLVSTVRSMGTAALILFLLSQQSLLKTFLSSPVLVFWGKRSYGLYIWQGLFFRTGLPSKYAFQSLPWSFFLTLLFTLLSYRYIETRFWQRHTRSSEI